VLTKVYICSTKIEEMTETILITLLIVAICIALLGMRIFFVKGGKFPNTHVSGNKALRDKGVGCAQSQDREARIENKLAVKEKSNKTKR